MLTSEQKTILTDTNAQYFGASVSALTDSTGKGIAKEIISKYGKEKSIGILCGLGKKGSDGLSAGKHLREMGASDVTVYLVGRGRDISSEAGVVMWGLLKGVKNSSSNLTRQSSTSKAVSVRQDVFAKDIERHDIFVECLSETGGKAKLNKRFGDIIKRVVKLDRKKVAFDVPAPGYKWDLSISALYPKTKDAVVIDIGLPKEVDIYCGPGEVKILEDPQRETYKTQNGQVLLIGGSEKYHGAPIMAAMIAAKIVGSVFFYSTPGNIELVKSMKKKLLEFVTVPEGELEKYAGYADVLLIGPGLEESMLNASLINDLLGKYKDKTKVLDAYAIAMADKSLLKGSILTPHRGELRHLFGELKKTDGYLLEGRLKRFAKEHGCYILLKGHTDMLFGPNGEFKMNKTGNPGMAKGGTGDILSGLIAAFATKNDPWVSMCAGAFVNGSAGDLLQKEVGYNYSATELIPKIQKVIKWAKELGVKL